jgi:hypothetical protein
MDRPAALALQMAIPRSKADGTNLVRRQATLVATLAMVALSLRPITETLPAQTDGQPSGARKPPVETRHKHRTRRKAAAAGRNSHPAQTAAPALSVIPV